jgi:hypothetical protein
MTLHRLKAMGFATILALSGLALAAGAPAAASPLNGTTGYRMVESWAKLPDGRAMAAVGKLAMAPDGKSIWAIIRCAAPDEPAPKAPTKLAPQFGFECLTSNLDPIVQFDLNGNVISSFGGGLFIWPHGLGVDRDGNIWVTDAVVASRIPKGDKRGEQVIKFSPDGKVLLRIGGVEARGNNRLTAPSDVAFTKEGDVLIADGHYEGGNNRVVRFTADGKYVGAWGKTGYGPSEFRGLHAIATDDAGRVYVGDRGNSRIQIFEPDGKYVTSWTQFGRPSGIFIAGDTIYVADSESDNVENPGYEIGIRIGEIKTGWVREFIPFPWANPNITRGTGAEFVTVDRQGNIYGGEPSPRNLQKYMRVRP